jgi:hypothetical protein
METARPGSSIRWERLCANISSKNVVAIIGNEMYKFNKDGNLLDLENYCSSQLLERNGITNVGFATIARTVEFLLKQQNADIRDIIDDLKSIVSTVKDFPLLQDFLDIDQVFFYVNTTVYGNILEDKIRALRDEESAEGNFSINETFVDFGNINALEVPFVFNIFGSLSNNVAPALKEEEMLEFTTSLITKMGDDKFASILDALKNKTILFLGCSQPYWLIRFIFRFLSNDRIDNWQRRQTDIFIINDKSDERASQFDFLKNYRAITYEGNTADFIGELKQKWTEYIKQHPPQPKRIFLSYAHKDQEAAELMFTKLKGLDYVQVWYDRTKLEAGDNFTDTIVEQITEADLFIPLISNNSLGPESPYVKREWEYAHNQNIMRRIRRPDKKVKFLLPVTIDNANLGHELINEYFNSLSIATVPGGNADNNFLEVVRKQLELV